MRAVSMLTETDIILLIHDMHVVYTHTDKINNNWNNHVMSALLYCIYNYM